MLTKDDLALLDGPASAQDVANEIVAQMEATRQKKLRKVQGFGPLPAKILIVGEAPGKSEEEQGKPFIGASGSELTKMLNEAGILRTEVRVTNVCKYRPPNNKMDLWWPKKKKDIRPGMQQLDGEYFDPRVIEGLEELEEEIDACQPNVIVPLGNLPLWATTRKTGITNWRGSLLQHSRLNKTGQPIKVIPAIHPAAILRKWDWRYWTVNDLRRVARWQSYVGYPSIEENFLVAPTFEQVRDTLEELLRRCIEGPTDLAVDIETKKRHLACLGIAWSKKDAICIPFICNEKPEGYFSLEEEWAIVLLLRKLLTHKNARGIGQNWQYDYRYIAKYWGFEINLDMDTMTEHHTNFAGLPKSLAFQSSIYRDIHIFWKDDGKEQGHGNQLEWWRYNCRDCVSTFEIAQVLRTVRNSMPLRETEYGTPRDIQQSLSLPMARASHRGVKLNHKLRSQMAFHLHNDIAIAETWLNNILGEEFNCNSNPQMSRLFYNELKLPKILHRKTRKPTLNAEALDTIAQRNILLRPLCQGINHIRSLKNCLSVCLQQTDTDGRLRCQYSIPGTETFRFNSSADPFGFGGNLQNITTGNRADKHFPLPNIRRTVIPDEGYEIGEFDLPQADARVVAWEAGDDDLIQLFADPSRHLHMENAAAIFGRRPQSKDDREYYYAKQGVHLTNYGGSPQVLAMTLGITVHAAEQFQKKWFGAHPKIKIWQENVNMQLITKRYVENKYGYRRFYFDRIEGLLKEALAWIPQSTVAVATNLGILRVDADSTLRSLGVQLLLQVHDSAVFQWPIRNRNAVLPRILEKMTVTVPYPTPLVFQGGAKVSTVSWGDVEDLKIAA